MRSFKVLFQYFFTSYVKTPINRTCFCTFLQYYDILNNIYHGTAFILEKLSFKSFTHVMRRYYMSIQLYFLLGNKISHKKSLNRGTRQFLFRVYKTGLFPGLLAIDSIYITKNTVHSHVYPKKTCLFLRKFEFSPTFKLFFSHFHCNRILLTQMYISM